MQIGRIYLDMITQCIIVHFLMGTTRDIDLVPVKRPKVKLLGVTEKNIRPIHSMQFIPNIRYLPAQDHRTTVSPRNEIAVSIISLPGYGLQNTFYESLSVPHVDVSSVCSNHF